MSDVYQSGCEQVHQVSRHRQGPVLLLSFQLWPLSLPPLFRRLQWSSRNHPKLPQPFRSEQTDGFCRTQKKGSRIIYTDGFVPLGGSADSVLSQIAAQRKRAAGLIDVKAHTPEKTQTQSQPSVTPSAPTLTLPDISLPDIHSHPSLVASDVHSRRVCAPSPTFNLSRHTR